MRRVAGDGADVEAVLQVAQDVVARIDDGHVVGLLPGQLLGGGTSHLTGAENDDFQLDSQAAAGLGGVADSNAAAGGPRPG